MTTDATFDLILAPVRAMSLPDQLTFWRKFRATHRRRIAKTEAQLCPEFMKSVDTLIDNIRQRLTQGE